MGYTHYLKPTRTLTDAEWTKFTDTCKAIFAATDTPLADGSGARGTAPEVEEGLVSFNGEGPDSYETCWIAQENTGFNSTKTNHKPYDTVVVAVFLAFADIHGGVIFSSDGDNADMVEGFALLKKAQGTNPDPKAKKEMSSAKGVIFSDLSADAPDPKVTEMTPLELTKRIASGYYTSSKSAIAAAKSALSSTDTAK